MFAKILILTTVVAVVYGGGRSLSAQESRQYLDLFRRYCGSGKSAQNQDGNTFYYCKFSDNGPATVQVNHDAEVNSGETPKQVIFVQPPTYNYVHNVALRGSPGTPQQTEIFVLPPTAEHQLQLQDTRSAVQAQKPSLIYLTNESNNGNGATAVLGGQVRPGVGVAAGTGSSNRPSAPPPRGQSPNVVEGGYNYYGAPETVNPRNSRHVQAYRTPYSTL